MEYCYAVESAAPLRNAYATLHPGNRAAWALFCLFLVLPDFWYPECAADSNAGGASRQRFLDPDAVPNRKPGPRDADFAPRRCRSNSAPAGCRSTQGRPIAAGTAESAPHRYRVRQSRWLQPRPDGTAGTVRAAASRAGTSAPHTTGAWVLRK